MAFNMDSIGELMPSGIPRNIPVSPNSQPVALQYWMRGVDTAPLPASYYHEEYIWPSGVIYGTDGRKSSYGAVNVGQFTEAAFYLDVTLFTRDDSDEYLDVVLETSYNQGNSWTRFARFHRVETTGAQTQIIVLEPSGVIGFLRNCESNDPEQGQVLTSFLGDRVRAAGTFIDAAGADSSGVFSVYGIFKRPY